MNVTVLKLLLSPIIIGGASLAGRRWGPVISGWLIGLPLTSGPVIFFLALSHDLSFVSASILGTLSGGFSLVAFCLVYAWTAVHLDWRASILASLFAFGVFTLLMQNVIVPFLPLWVAVVAVIVLGLRAMPRQQIVQLPDTEAGPWDIPARIVIGTGFILLLTGVAPLIGARLTGLLATIPLYTAILTVFAHRGQGPAAAAHVLRGLLFGLFGFAGFFLTLGLLIESAGIALSFAAAILVTLTVQSGTLLFIRRTTKEAAA